MQTALACFVKIAGFRSLAVPLSFFFQGARDIGMMSSSGELGKEWGFRHTTGTAEVTHVPDRVKADLVSVELHSLVSNTSLLHTACLESFQAHSSPMGYILSARDLRNSLNMICGSCEIEPMSDEEVDDLWCGQVNFSEFFMLCKELFTAMHRAIMTGGGLAPDALYVNLPDEDDPHPA